jgi:imidazolonepropionase
LPNVLAVINCSQLVTLGGAHRPRTGGDLRQLAIIEDGALLVRGEVIEAVGRRREIENLISAECEVIDAGRRVVMPGFVDAHTHPVFAGIRANEFEQRSTGATYREIAARGGGIRATVRSTRNASLPDLVKAGRRYTDWFLRTGTTTVEAKSGYGLTVEDELKILRAIKQLNEETPLRYVPILI